MDHRGTRTSRVGRYRLAQDQDLAFEVAIRRYRQRVGEPQLRTIVLGKD